MTSTGPRVAVVMPVRNAAPYLDASIASVLNQTFADFEFVALDDASTDGSSDILSAWAARDCRLRIERVSQSLGLVGSSNAVVRASRAPIVARMDADDVSYPERLEKQVRTLEQRPDAVLVATLFEGIDASGRSVRTRDRWRLLGPSPFAPFPHGSVMFRRAAFEAVGGYDPAAQFWEDLNLFRRMGTKGPILVIPEALYKYRFHPANVRSADEREEVEEAVTRMWHAVNHGKRPGRGDHSLSRLAHDPHVLYSLAASRLWAGYPPDLLSRLRLRALLRPTPSTMAIFMIAAMAAVSPKATRFLLGRVIASRDRLAGLKLGSEPLEWRFAS